jgi:hypothetical protein
MKKLYSTVEIEAEIVQVYKDGYEICVNGVTTFIPFDLEEEEV